MLLAGGGTKIGWVVLTGRAVCGGPCLAVASAQGSPGSLHQCRGPGGGKENEDCAKMTPNLFGPVSTCCFFNNSDFEFQQQTFMEHLLCV